MTLKSTLKLNQGRAITAILLLALTGLLLTSCKVREKCPAYGEYRRFQVEQGY